MRDPTSSVSRSVRVRPRTHRDRVAKSPGSQCEVWLQTRLAQAANDPETRDAAPEHNRRQLHHDVCLPDRVNARVGARSARPCGRPCGQVTHERIVQPVALEPEPEQGGEVVDALARKVERVGERAVDGAAGNREARLRARGDRVLGRFAVRIRGDLDVASRMVSRASLQRGAHRSPGSCSASSGRDG